jgi:hypothetical protein
MTRDLDQTQKERPLIDILGKSGKVINITNLASMGENADLKSPIGMQLTPILHTEGDKISNTNKDNFGFEKLPVTPLGTS